MCFWGDFSQSCYTVELIKRSAANTTDELFDDHDAETDHGSNDDVVKRLNGKKPNTFSYSSDDFGNVGSFENRNR